MYFVGVLAKAGKLRYKLKKVLEAQSLFQVEEFSSSPDLMAAVRQGRISTMIIKVEKFKASHIDVMKGLIATLPCVSVLMVADVIPETLRSQFADLKLPGAGILDLRFELKDIAHITRKLGNSDDQIVRRHCRFDTFESIGVFTSNGYNSDGTLLNVSNGGACVRIHGKAIHIGAPISIKVNNSDSSLGQKLILGKVVWSREDSHLLGVQFDRPEASLNENYSTAV